MLPQKKLLNISDDKDFENGIINHQMNKYP